MVLVVRRAAAGNLEQVDIVPGSPSDIYWSWNGLGVSQFGTPYSLGVGAVGAMRVRFIAAGGTNQGPRFAFEPDPAVNGGVIAASQARLYCVPIAADIVGPPVPRRYRMLMRRVAGNTGLSDRAWGTYLHTQNNDYGMTRVFIDGAGTRRGVRVEAGAVGATGANLTTGAAQIDNVLTDQLHEIQVTSPGVGGPLGFKLSDLFQAPNGIAHVADVNSTTYLPFGTWPGTPQGFVSLVFTYGSAGSANLSNFSYEFDLMQLRRHPLDQS